MAETFNFREDQVAVSRLAWDMAQWELHYLRGVFGTLIVEDTLHARNGKRLRHDYEEACLRALRDPGYRNRDGC
jgi:hypothetical protein